MKNEKNELLFFLGGVAMCAVGLFILFNRVHVGSGWGFFGSFMIGRFSFPSGLVVIPFIIGIVWMFASDGSLISKFFTALTVLLIIVAIIMTTHFWLDTMTMFDWLLILILIFGGGAMIAKVLFTNHGPEKKAEIDKETKRQIDSLQKELDDLKKEKNNQ